MLLPIYNAVGRRCWIVENVNRKSEKFYTSFPE